MDFKEPYLMAMQEQAPDQYRQLKRSGALMSHLQQKTKEAHDLFIQLTAKAEKLPSGTISDPQVDGQAEEAVLTQTIEFPA